MIKTAILGGGSPDGGELLRILAHHPDVEIIAVQASEPELDGTKVTSLHHGLIGEITHSFTSTIDLEKCDVLFVCNEDYTYEGILALHNRYPELRIIILHALRGIDPGNEFVFGLPEINRKQLVRGARLAIAPESLASMALVALFPFAKHLLLNDDIRIGVTAPASIVETTDIDAVKREIREVLSVVQMSFSSEIEFEIKAGETRRSALMEIEFDCQLELQQMLDLYEIYDDHNFAFATTVPIGVSEVAGTNKCIISVARVKEGRAKLTVAADCRLRGAAGEAVHIMNLMTGLHEKTGLALKASDYEPIN